jgi:hypothetical protein
MARAAVPRKQRPLTLSRRKTLGFLPSALRVYGVRWRSTATANSRSGRVVGSPVI